MKRITNAEASELFRTAANMLDTLTEGDPVAETLKDVAIESSGRIVSKVAGNFVSSLMRGILPKKASSSPVDEETKRPCGCRFRKIHGFCDCS